ncbi:SDR family NAD(P)-dependent oxidoreductase [Sphingobium chlorophenolicum]|uniref:3-alpha-(Or 20-beta)-hydroxysteroid dehydrogenase n=1 Tax=Sphingobium chlorophenolicum TaxID=46429 RepID=A0A081R9C5_SPHCR|nr:SDR family oxidoreductase [Sphingobium chlorophenolicum]KEQ51798.1 3-alpha-(Or 20-beta)-hydroxysteroid dehydrogenase [Sphingobium chlorophenolicum]
MNRLHNKIAIITGAASGQGAAEARRFVEEGAKVVITDLNEVDGKALADQLGDSAIFVSHDVSDEASWQRVVEQCLAAFGGIDILVNNAGIYRQKSLAETDQALMDLHYRVNVLGAFFGMKAVHPVMKAHDGGAIVNISSIAALRGSPGLFAYAGSKWMVRGMTKSAAQDLAQDKIRVNTVLPGLIDTPMLAGNAPEYLEEIKQMVPFKRLGAPEEIADAVVYLASDESRYVTGAEITVCGGMSA